MSVYSYIINFVQSAKKDHNIMLYNKNKTSKISEKSYNFWYCWWIFNCLSSFKPKSRTKRSFVLLCIFKIIVVFFFNRIYSESFGFLNNIFHSFWFSAIFIQLFTFIILISFKIYFYLLLSLYLQ